MTHSRERIDSFVNLAGPRYYTYNELIPEAQRHLTINNHGYNIFQINSRFDEKISNCTSEKKRQRLLKLRDKEKEEFEKRNLCKIETREDVALESGKGLVKIIDNGAIIYYSPQDKYNELVRHLIVTHEIGHIFLHPNEAREKRITQEMEDEANYYASEVTKKWHDNYSPENTTFRFSY
ncbi:MAG: hypothetical protein FWH10_07200, partial [Oscillospiraceae bacterium]|nr:hypothetical protein [Oscillospiraceae bacterium]